MGIKAMRKLNSGFTLIELSIVLVVLGILIAGIIQFFGGIAEIRKEQETRAKIEEIQDAILAFTTKNGRLPCPANRNAAFPDSDFGIETDCQASQSFECPIISGTSERECADSGSGSNEIRTGVLPVRTLGLPDEYMFDAWDNRFTYSAIKDITEKQGSCGTYNSDSTALGVIRIQGISGDVINPPKECLDASGANPACASVAYNIISHGENGIGAFNRDGNQSIQCNTATAEGENCDNDNIFKDILENEGTGTDANALYDDIIAWETYSRIEREVFAGGSGEALGSGASFVFTLTDNATSAVRNFDLVLDNSSDYIWECSNCTSLEIGDSPSSLSTTSPYTSTGATQEVYFGEITTPGNVDAIIRVCSQDEFTGLTELSFDGFNQNHAVLTDMFTTTSSNFDMPDLTTLDLKRVNFSSFPAKITEFDSLVNLDLNSNDLTTIPSSISNLVSLSLLNLNFNDLTNADIPPELFTLTNLQQLRLRRNNLDSIPAGISNLTALTDFQADENDITSITSEIGSMSNNFRTLNLRSNEITSINNAINNLTLNSVGIASINLHDQGNGMTEADFESFITDLHSKRGTNFCALTVRTDLRFENLTTSNCMTPATASLLTTIDSTSCDIVNQPIERGTGDPSCP